MMELTAETLHRAHEAGVVFVTGTDTGFAVTPYGEWHARELQLLMDYAGLSELEAIRAATVNAAVTVGLENQLGQLRPGMLADIVVVAGDPLADIGVLLRKEAIVAVVKHGRIAPFVDELDELRWPNERFQLQSEGDLTRELVAAASQGGQVEVDAVPNGRDRPLSGRTRTELF